MDEYYDRAPQCEAPAIERILRDAGYDMSDGLEFSLLSGGFQNWNYVVRVGNGDPFVLRIVKCPEVLEKEFKLLSRMAAAGDGIPMPRGLWCRSRAGAPPVAAMTFMPGELLWKARTRLDSGARRKVSANLGGILARIHAQKYAHFGFLNADVEVAQPVESYTDWTVGHIHSCIASVRFRRRLDEGLIRRLEQCIVQNAPLHDAACEPCLCHGDFNEKNILIDLDATGGPTVSAVLDWEYALAGAPHFDIGNLFRFSAVDPWIDSPAFESGYVEAGGELDVNWLSRALLADLVAMCHMLDSEEDSPRSHATAAALIEKSVGRLGG
ncbi:MAG: phosphotransferase family protein [Candidatus Sumerlaeaceae bacterium]